MKGTCGACVHLRREVHPELREYQEVTVTRWFKPDTTKRVLVQRIKGYTDFLCTRHPQWCQVPGESHWCGDYVECLEPKGAPSTSA